MCVQFSIMESAWHGPLFIYFLWQGHTCPVNGPKHWEGLEVPELRARLPTQQNDRE